MKPDLSIILPVFNQADHIADVVRRYLSQFKGRSNEIVLVPNACQDDSARICRKLEKASKMIRVVENPKGGWGLSVRMGLQTARGRFLCYTNSARTDPATVAALFSKARRRPEALFRSTAWPGANIYGKRVPFCIIWNAGGYWGSRLGTSTEPPRFFPPGF